jgi:hypothetical protein
MNASHDNFQDYSQFPVKTMANAAADRATWICQTAFEGIPAVEESESAIDRAADDMFWRVDALERLNEDEKVALPFVYFLTRHCHSLALAIHELTGWKMAGMGWEEHSRVPNHVFVITPDGKGLDITGTFTLGEGEGAHVRTSYRATDIKSLSPEQVHGFTDTSQYEYYASVDMDTARIYALRLLSTMLSNLSKPI